MSVIVYLYILIVIYFNYAQLCDLSGTNTYEIAGDGGEGSIDITIIAYTCDDDVNECESDCIDVSGFSIDDSSTNTQMAALLIGSCHTINRYYCYDASCYFNDTEDGYTVELTLSEETNPDGGELNGASCI